MSRISMRQLLEAGVHFGHQTRHWCPKMAPYIFGERNKIHIFNLEHTVPMLEESLNFMGQLSAKGGKVLFVGTKRAARDAVSQAASACNMPYVDKRWLGGMMTNFRTVKQSVRRMKEIESQIEDGIEQRLNKKEFLMLTREHAKLEGSLGGIRDMERLPDAIFVIDTGHEKIAIAEARKLGIPVVGIVDSNNNPKDVDYVIPGNDDAVRAIKLFATAAAEAIQDAKTASSGGGSKDDFVEVSEPAAETPAASE
ncbi:MAG: 30S ribosomal protein S2 [Granulosicoccaceae bacterium]